MTLKILNSNELELILSIDGQARTSAKGLRLRRRLVFTKAGKPSLST